MSYIFRWKPEYGGGHYVEVEPSEHDTPEEVWNWAVKWLRGASDTDSAKVKRDLKRCGEVVEVQP